MPYEKSGLAAVAMVPAVEAHIADGDSSNGGISNGAGRRCGCMGACVPQQVFLPRAYACPGTFIMGTWALPGLVP